MIRKSIQFVKKVHKRLHLFTDKRWIIFFLQRQILDPGRRDRIAEKFIHYWRPTLKANCLHTVHTKEQQELHESGIITFDNLFSPQELKEITNYLTNCKVQDPYNIKIKPFYPQDVAAKTPKSHVAFHEPVDVINAPYFLKLANNPTILNIVTHFLGCKPTIGYMAAWWSYPTGIGPQEAENFHRDVDDWKFVKLFVYLSDVDKNTGPHIYVKGSARQNKLLKIKRFADEEVFQAYPQKDIVMMTSKAGNGFLENTFGIHRGTPLKTGTRLMFQVVYSLMPLPYGPKKPIANMTNFPIQLDPWVNRVYIKS